MNQPQEGAESILDHAKPVDARVGLSFWQMCKLKAWDAAVGVIASVPLVLVFLHTAKPAEAPALSVTAVAAPTSEPVQTAETPNEPHTTPKKIAFKAIKTPARSSNSSEFDDVLGDFIAKIEREKAQIAAVNVAPAMPAPSASNLKQDFQSRLFNFERKIP